MAPSAVVTPRRGDIQGLRALAVALVVLAHAGVAGFSGGFVGVDVFFVISGYLITSLLLREIDRTGRVSLTGFYARRARRILPAATLTLLAVTAFVAATEPLNRISETATDARWSAAFLANVHFANAGTDYFADPEPSLFQHFWSLAVEEQFYLVWPLLLLALAPRIGRRALALTLGALALASLAWSVYLAQAEPLAGYFSSFTRAHELIVGALLALVGDRVRHRGAPWAGVLGLAGVAALAIATVTFNEQMAFPGWAALLPVLGTAALIVSGDGASPGVGRLLAVRPVRWLGDLSYSLYLWHWPVLLLGQRHLDWAPWLRTPFLIALAVALAWVSYRLVELPFQRGRLPLSSGRPALALWPLALTTVLLVAWLSINQGERAIAQRNDEASAWFDENPEAQATADPNADGAIADDVREALAWAEQGAPLPPTIDLEALSDDVWNRAYRCYARWGDAQAEICPVGDTSAETTVVLFGDSHAGQWLPGLDALGRDRGFRVVPLLKMACGPYDVPQWTAQMPREVCEGFRSWARDQIEQLAPDAVILAGRGLRSTRSVDGEPVETTWSKGVRSTLAQLTPLTRQVKVLADVATRETYPADCLSRADADQSDCLTPLAGPEIESNVLTAAAVEGSSADFVDVVPLVCAETGCPLVVGESVVYFDEDHISATWSELVHPALGDLLALDT